MQNDDRWISPTDDFLKVRYSRADLEDGRLLRNAVYVYSRGEERASFLGVLEILRSSIVYMPCNLEFSEEAVGILDRLKILDQGSVGFIPGVDESFMLLQGFVQVQGTIEGEMGVLFDDLVIIQIHVRQEVIELLEGIGLGEVDKVSAF